MVLKDFPPQAGRHGYIVIKERVHGDHYLLIRDCPFCFKESRVIIPAQGLWDWEHGAYIQVAFPHLSPAQREQVKTGIHEDCWDEVMKEEDEG